MFYDLLVFVFFFKQKTAYEMRISDWSSDVGSSELRFTAREMIAAEQRLERAAEGLAIDRGHGVADAHVTRALASAEGRGLDLSAEQRGALAHITGDKGLASVVGYAGSGKSAMLGVAREAWEAQGYQVRGAALSGIAA